MPTASEPNELTDPKEIRKFLERAQKGDESTLPVLREMLKKPHWLEPCGNLAKHAENALIRKFAAKDLAVREGLRKKLEVMQDELAGPASAPLERLLAERIVACWLHVYYLETVYANKDGMSLDLATHYTEVHRSCPSALPVRHQDAGHRAQASPACLASQHRQETGERGWPVPAH